MTKDYAKKSKTSRKKSSKGNAKKIWIIAILLLIVATFSFVYPTKSRPRFLYLTQKFFIKKTTDVAATATKKKTSPPEITKTSTPRFDFYNILPGKKVAPAEAQYELEIAHAKTFSAADQLKAELALLGFTVNITPIYKQGAQKYYVSIGPYDCKKTAAADQNKLKQNKIRSLLRKLH